MGHKDTHLESLGYKLLGRLVDPRGCYGVLGFIMESGAKGFQVVCSVWEALRERAKAMKLVEIHPINYYTDTACTMCCSDRVCGTSK